MIYLINTYRFLNRLISDSNRIFILFFKIAASLLLLYLLISEISFSSILKSLEKANYPLLLCAFGLCFLNVYLQFVKWKIVSSQLIGLTNSKKIWISLFCGFSAGVVTPLRLGEYAGRGIMLREKNLRDVIAATFIDKLFPLIMVVFFGGFSSLLYLIYFQDFEAVYLLLIAPGAIAATAILFKSNKFKTKIKEKIILFTDKINILKRLHVRFVLKVSLISFLFYCCFIIQFILLIAAFSGGTNYLDFLWAGNLVMFSKTIIPPVSLGELGIREGASIFFLGEFGVTAAAALNASLFLFFINVLLPSLVGIIFFFKKNNV